MAARIKHHSIYRNVWIYKSARTHPTARTVSLIVFTSDTPGYKGPTLNMRFRYVKNNADSERTAVAEAQNFIKKYETPTTIVDLGNANDQL